MTNSKQNIYDTFINACKQKTYPKHTRLHKHHIVPKHDGGGDETENLIVLSFELHYKAHVLRYEVYQQNGDRWCVGFMGKNINPET